jgi:hypothetical protein
MNAYLQENYESESPESWIASNEWAQWLLSDL